MGSGIDGSRITASYFTLDTNDRSILSLTDYGKDGVSRAYIWDDGGDQSVDLTYSFSSENSIFNYNAPTQLYELNAKQKETAIDAMKAYSSVANITFTEVVDTSDGAGDIRWTGSNDEYSIPTSAAYLPEDSAEGGDIWIGSVYEDYTNPNPGEYGYDTFIHELGHALGLLHPHEDGDINEEMEEDCLKYSVMSYKSYAGDDGSWGGYTNEYYPTSLMLNDILALQHLYGANLDFKDTDGDGDINDTYSWDADAKIFETIYDAGGIDTIDASNQDQRVVINLKPGTFSTIGVEFVEGLGYWWWDELYTRDNLALAYEVRDENGNVVNYIENAIGSNYNDTLIGNATINILKGGRGNDILRGGRGNDTLYGGGGDDAMYGGDDDDAYYVNSTGDTVIEYADEGTDTIYSYVTYTSGDYIENLTLVGSANINATGNTLDNILTGNDAANALQGGQGNDTLYGAKGNDTLRGAKGNDAMYGGDDDDAYYVDSTGDTVIEYADEGTDTIYSYVTYTSGDYIENLTLVGSANINATGNTLDNILTGNDAANALQGGQGNDTLYGAKGNDTLRGAKGNDTLYGGGGDDAMYGGDDDDAYYVNSTGDTVIEYADEGTDTIYSYVTYTSGDYIENLTLVGSANINATGNTLDNILTGNDAANVLQGGQGNDTLYGAKGNDTLYGEQGNDTLYGGGGDDAMYGGDDDDAYYVNSTGDTVIEYADEGTDTIYSYVTYTSGDYIENLTLVGSANINATGNTLDNILTGNDAANALQGGQGNDTLYGAKGNDTLRGAKGNDAMYGGDDDDAYYVDSTGDTVIEYADEGTDTIYSYVTYTSGDYIENLTLVGSANINATGNTLDNILTGNDAANALQGGQGNDTLYGAKGNDTLRGAKGNDTLYGGGGDDAMYGGDDDDAYYVNSTGDTVIEYADEGTDTIYSYVTYTSGDYIENLTLVGSANINATGNTLDNILTGNDAANVLQGGQGNDTLYGAKGNDTLYGEQGNDTLYGGGGDDAMYGGDDDDAYYVNSTGDTVIEYADEGTDTIYSYVTYTSGDYIENLTLVGSANINATGNTLDNILTGNDAANALQGGQGNDTLYGAKGNDTLRGAKGNDAMYGGNGNDTLYGGDGNDVFIFDTSLDPISNIDTIIDFIALDDYIQLDSTIFEGLSDGWLTEDYFSATGTANDANDYLLYNQNSGELSFDIDGNGSNAAVVFAILDTQPNDITYQDFYVV